MEKVDLHRKVLLRQPSCLVCFILLQIRDDLLQPIDLVFLELVFQHDLFNFVFDEGGHVGRLSSRPELLLVILILSLQTLDLKLKHIIRSNDAIIHNLLQILVFFGAVVVLFETAIQSIGSFFVRSHKFKVIYFEGFCRLIHKIKVLENLFGVEDVIGLYS